MIILLIFLAIAVGVAIGVSEYYDSKHDGGGEKGTLEETRTSSSNSLEFTSLSGGPSTTTGPTSLLDSSVVTSTIISDSNTSRMRTIRTTSTHVPTPTSSPVRDSTSSSPTQSTSEDPSEPLSTESSTTDEPRTASPARETISGDSSDEPEIEEPTSVEEVSQTDRGRVLGLATPT